MLNNSGSAAIVTVSQGSHSIAVPVQLQNNVNVTAGNVSAVLSISGAISGAGAITKAGSGTLALTAVNSYTGNTTVQAGTLRITNRYLADTANVLLSTGATLDLQFSGSADMIHSLLINGAMQVTGLWGAVGNQSASFHTSLITGTGVLQVAAGPVVGDYNNDGKVDASDYVQPPGQYRATSITNRYRQTARARQVGISRATPSGQPPTRPGHAKPSRTLAVVRRPASGASGHHCSSISSSTHEIHQQPTV